MQRAVAIALLPSVSAYAIGVCPRGVGSLCRTPTLPDVQMNLGDRFVRLVKSNANELLNKMEDPEKVSAGEAQASASRVSWTTS